MSERAYIGFPVLVALVNLLRSGVSPEFITTIRAALVEDFNLAVKIGEGHRIAALKDALADIPDPTQQVSPVSELPDRNEFGIALTNP